MSYISLQLALVGHYESQFILFFGPNFILFVPKFVVCFPFELIGILFFFSTFNANFAIT